MQQLDMFSILAHPEYTWSATSRDERGRKWLTFDELAQMIGRRITLVFRSQPRDLEHDVKVERVQEIKGSRVLVYSYPDGLDYGFAPEAWFDSRSQKYPAGAYVEENNDAD